MPAACSCPQNEHLAFLLLPLSGDNNSKYCQESLSGRGIVREVDLTEEEEEEVKIKKRKRNKLHPFFDF